LLIAAWVTISGWLMPSCLICFHDRIATRLAPPL
jgi:hypothetical protein